MSFLSPNIVNTGRQPELDCLKALCIIAMIINHVLIDFSDGLDDGSLVTTFIDGVMLNMIGAVPFMMCMGIGMCYSKKQAPINNVMRGIILLTVAQLLNLLKDVAPNMIAYWATEKQWFIAQSVMVLQADILSFAGFALILMALFKKIKVPPVAIFGTGIVLNVISYLLYYFFGRISPSNYIVSQLLGFFVITDAESYFPLLSNFVFVAAGYWIGGLYPYIEDKNKLANRLLLILTPICILYYIARFHLFAIPFQPEFPQGLQFKLNLDVIAAILNSIVLLCALYKVARLNHNNVPKPLAHLSYNINNYYCISFMFIVPVNTLMLAVWGHLIDSDIFPIFYGIFVIVACYFLVELYKKKIKPQFKKLPACSMYILFAAIWILSAATVIYAYPKIETPANMWNEYLVPEFEEANADSDI